MNGPNPHVDRAPHAVGPSRAEQRLTAALRRTGHRLWFAEISNGVPDVAVDVLAAGSDGPTGDEPTPGELRAELGRVGRLISMTFLQLEKEVEERARTGRLIRLVLRTGTGAALCFAVVPRQHVVGVALGTAAEGDRAEREADLLLRDLVADLRADRGLSDQHPGGVTGSAPARADDTSLHEGGGSDRAVWSRARAAVAVSDLHWCGLVEEDRVVATVDRLSSPALEEHFRLMAPHARRGYYEELAAGAAALLARLGRIVHPVAPGPVQHLVLDVEEGAVVIRRLDDRTCLVGVTLNQEQVQRAETTVAGLADGAATGNAVPRFD